MSVDELELSAEKLRRRLDPESLPFETTAEVEPLTQTIGQSRALAALDFGLSVGTAGYNLFLVGESGSGKESTLRSQLEQLREEMPTPSDWIYVHNFSDADRPRAIELPAGRGRELARDMQELVEAAREEIPRALESEEFAAEQERALAEPSKRREELMKEVQDVAAERGFAVQGTPGGLAHFPVREGRPMGPQEMAKLSQSEREDLERRGEEVKERMDSAVREVRRLEKEARERNRQLTRQTAQRAIDPRIDELRGKYGAQDEVIDFLNGVREDIPEHLASLSSDSEDEQQHPLAQLQHAQREEELARYQVNVFIDNSEAEGAPVIVERNPTYYNLVGRIEYRPAFGTMVTDVRQIKPGALQRANGGYLVIHALELLREPLSWEALKRAVRAGEVRIENLGQQLSPVPTSTLRPAPVPLRVKVVLVGPRSLYHLLLSLDEDFEELFKVKVDFAPDMDWDADSVRGYAAFVSRCVQDCELRPFDRAAVARVVEHAAWLRGDQRKLSARLRAITDVVTEAGFWAGRAERETVAAEDVEQAIAQKEFRSNLLEERVQELIADGTIMIDTDRSRVGRVNGLAITDVGDHSFGRPTRISARARLGEGKVASIEREIELSDPSHSKGFLILSGFLSERYVPDLPLALQATITLEQSYDEVAGDSASAAELYALLSALADVPLSQGIAVTGSVNQHGELQPVGGVTRKIEGFFAACKARGLDGSQGAIIPRANVRHLMLSPEVTDAVRDGSFHVWAAETIDEGMEVLAGIPAGEREEGGYPDGSVNRRVEERLRGFAEKMRAFGFAGDGRRAAPDQQARSA